MLLLKECWVGGNLTFFGPPRLSTKKVHLNFLKAKRVLMWFVLYFSSLRRLNWMKKNPHGIFFGVFRLSKYENTNDHVLVRARKIHESMLYQAFFCLFFKLAKNEDGPEFFFLESLSLYKKERKESSFTCNLHHRIKSCFLEQSTNFESINSWVLVF